MPVSYTHLDVYKRQAVSDVFIKNKERFLSLGVFMKDNPNPQTSTLGKDQNV